MREITAYQTSDGQLFTDDRKAKDHQEDLLGIALDNLIPFVEGNMTRNDQYRLLLAIMKDPELNQKIEVLYNILTFEE